MFRNLHESIPGARGAWGWWVAVAALDDGLSSGGGRATAWSHSGGRSQESAVEELRRGEIWWFWERSTFVIFVGWSDMISELVLASFCWGWSSSESRKKKGSRKGHCSHVFRTWTLEKGVGMFWTQLHRGWKMQALPPKRWNFKILNGFNRIRHILVRYGKHVQLLQVIRLPVLSGLISSTCSSCIPELFECQAINTYQLIPCPRLQWGVSWLKGLWMWVCLARAAGPVSEKLKAFFWPGLMIVAMDKTPRVFGNPQLYRSQHWETALVKMGPIFSFSRKLSH